jgi:hypothetical protein
MYDVNACMMTKILELVAFILLIPAIAPLLSTPNAAIATAYMLRSKEDGTSTVEWSISNVEHITIFFPSFSFRYVVVVATL